MGLLVQVILLFCIPVILVNGGLIIAGHERTVHSDISELPGVIDDTDACKSEQRQECPTNDKQPDIGQNATKEKKPDSHVKQHFVGPKNTSRDNNHSHHPPINNTGQNTNTTKPAVENHEHPVSKGKDEVSKTPANNLRNNTKRPIQSSPKNPSKPSTRITKDKDINSPKDHENSKPRVTDKAKKESDSRPIIFPGKVHQSKENPKKEKLKEEKPKEEKPKEEKPKEEKPKEEKPNEEKPKEEKPKEEKPKEVKPKEEKPRKEKPKNVKPKNEGIKKESAKVEPTEETPRVNEPDTSNRIEPSCQNCNLLRYAIDVAPNADQLNQPYNPNAVPTNNAQPIVSQPNTNRYYQSVPMNTPSYLPQNHYGNQPVMVSTYVQNPNTQMPSNNVNNVNNPTQMYVPNNLPISTSPVSSSYLTGTPSTGQYYYMLPLNNQFGYVPISDQNMQQDNGQVIYVPVLDNQYNQEVNYEPVDGNQNAVPINQQVNYIPVANNPDNQQVVYLPINDDQSAVQIDQQPSYIPITNDQDNQQVSYVPVDYDQNVLPNNQQMIYAPEEASDIAAQNNQPISYMPVTSNQNTVVDQPESYVPTAYSENVLNTEPQNNQYVGEQPSNNSQENEGQVTDPSGAFTLGHIDPNMPLLLLKDKDKADEAVSSPEHKVHIYVNNS